MSKRPKDGPFGALAALHKQVRHAASAEPTKASPPSAASADDSNAFLEEMKGTTPLKQDNRAQIERAKPEAKVRPQPEVFPPLPARRIDPDDVNALLREAMSGVVPLPNRGQADIPRRPSVKSQQIPTANKEATTGADADSLSTRQYLLPPLPDDEHDPAALFRRAIGSANPLPDRGLAALNKPLPPPHPRQKEMDEAAALRESIAAPMSFQDRLDTGNESSHLRNGIPRRVLTDLRRGRWAVQDELDLHGLTRDEARPALSAFLQQALERGFRCIRLIHGKGLSSPGREPVLKHLSRGWLMQREEILAFCQARPHDGGEGALLVLLRNQNKAG